MSLIKSTTPLPDGNFAINIDPDCRMVKENARPTDAAGQLINPIPLSLLSTLAEHQKYPTEPLYPNSSHVKDPHADPSIQYSTSYYALGAITVHHGASIASGHYTSYIRTASPQLCSGAKTLSQGGNNDYQFLWNPDQVDVLRNINSRVGKQRELLREVVVQKNQLEILKNIAENKDGGKGGSGFGSSNASGGSGKKSKGGDKGKDAGAGAAGEEASAITQQQLNVLDTKSQLILNQFKLNTVPDVLGLQAQVAKDCAGAVAGIVGAGGQQKQPQQQQQGKKKQSNLPSGPTTYTQHLTYQDEETLLQLDLSDHDALFKTLPTTNHSIGYPITQYRPTILYGGQCPMVKL